MQYLEKFEIIKIIKANTKLWHVIHRSGLQNIYGIRSMLQFANQVVQPYIFGAHR